MKEKEKNYLKKFAKECTLPIFDRELYAKYDVKRGLRDINGKGVVAGLTNISEIKASEIVDGKSVPAEGELYYRGYPIEELVGGCLKDGRFGFEEVTYLLLTGKLPTAKELDEFRKYLTSFYTLPKNFVRDIIMKSPSEDMMNTLIRSVLALFPYDAKANDTSIENVVRQCVMLTAVLPIFTVYSYAACNFYKKGESLIIHRPRTDLSTAENILYMLRPDCSYTELEARVLDLALILHAEHGGGNNSTFTTHVVTSSGTDTYSAVAAALCSLKGPKHGGANIKVVRMIKDMEKNINITNDDEVRKYLEDLVDGKAFDRAGLIYGMGHAVYSISDPRAKIFKNFVHKLAKAKHRDKTFALYDKIERLAPEVIAEKRHIYKGVSANVDFYSGFVYDMLNIPTELYTPIFAVARIAGWSAHRIEELTNEGKIIRPAYKSVGEHRQYIPMKNR
ncbi:MAG: citrate/2-methylcitrate synthase [Eubacteriales bacterium]|nr:citrate/2-methylcitrate synthase [Eubacteriales bacterium]